MGKLPPVFSSSCFLVFPALGTSTFGNFYLSLIYFVLTVQGSEFSMGIEHENLVQFLEPEGDRERDNKIKLANFESSIKQGF